MSIRTLLLSILVFLGPAQTAYTAPFEVVGGYLQADMLCGCDSIGYQLLGSDFEVGGHGPNADWYNGFEHQVVSPNIPTSLGATLPVHAADPIITNATINRIEYLYPNVLITGMLTFSGVGSPLFDTMGPQQSTGLFNMTGLVSGVDASTSNVLFQMQLIGSGQAASNYECELVDLRTSCFLEIRTYTFNKSVPEPSTLALLLLPVAWLLAKPSGRHEL
jgi:hypothetical protein